MRMRFTVIELILTCLKSVAHYDEFFHLVVWGLRNYSNVVRFLSVHQRQHIQLPRHPFPLKFLEYSLPMKAFTIRMVHPIWIQNLVKYSFLYKNNVYISFNIYEYENTHIQNLFGVTSNISGTISFSREAFSTSNDEHELTKSALASSCMNIFMSQFYFAGVDKKINKLFRNNLHFIR